MATSGGFASPITSADRCDGTTSGVEQASVRVLLRSGRELFLCGHHVRQHFPKLQEKVEKIFDATGTLQWSRDAGTLPKR